MWLLGFWGSNRLGEGPGELPLPVTSPQNVFLPKSESSQAQERMSFLPRPPYWPAGFGDRYQPL